MTYPRPGDSDEDRNLIAYGLQTPGSYITCTTDHGLFTGAGFISSHRLPGTNGNGRAIDLAGPDMKSIFRHFLEHRELLHELIHTPMGFSISDGKTVGPIAAKDHYNHVHVSVKKGVLLPIDIPIPAPSTNKEQPNMMAYDPVSGGSWTLDETGAVFANDGAPYCEAPNNHPAWNAANPQANHDWGLNPSNGHFTGIAPWKGDGTDQHGNGYAIGFRFNNSPQPSLYHFDRARTGKS